MPPALKGRSLNHWTAREVPPASLKANYCIGVSSGPWDMNGSDVNSLQARCLALPFLPSHGLKPRPGPGEAASAMKTKARPGG